VLGWEAGTPAERRLLVEEYIEAVMVFPDHLEVQVAGLLPRSTSRWLRWDCGTVGRKAACRRTDPNHAVPEDIGALSPGE